MALVFEWLGDQFGHKTALVASYQARSLAALERFQRKLPDEDAEEANDLVNSGVDSARAVWQGIVGDGGATA